PTSGNAGIGTQLSGGTTCALQIHYDTSIAHPTQPAYLRLSNGTSTTSDVFGFLGLMPIAATTTYSSLSRGQDLVLHQNRLGDVIVTNWWPAQPLSHATGGSIRFATAGDTTKIGDTSAFFSHDYERLTILGSTGNIGIALQPDPVTGLVVPMDQLQIGGGMAPIGIDSSDGKNRPLPGLTLSGGS